MIGIVWVIIGSVLFGFYNAYLLLDDKTQENSPKNKELEDSWHMLGAAIFSYLSATAWMMFGVEYAPLCLCCFWVIYASIVHKVALKQSFFYVGTSAATDKLFRKVFPKNTETWSGVVKVTCLVASFLIIFLKNA